MGLLFFGMVNVSYGQVTIKERVELQPHVFQGQLGDNPTEVVYVAGDSGTFAGTVILAHKYTPIVPGRLSVTLRGETFDYNTVDYVDHYVTRGGQEEWRCSDGLHVQFTGYSAMSQYGYPLRFFLPDVHIGDTLHFVYHGSTDIPATSFSNPRFEGNVFMYLTDDCYTYPDEGTLQELEMCAVALGVVYPDTAGFRIVTERDTISHGEAIAVRAVAVDVNGGEVQIDSTTVVRYTQLPDTLGSFIDTNGDPVNSVDARYADARTGRIRFVANKSKPDSARFVAIEVIQMSDTLKRGRDTLWVKPDVIEILLGETKYYQARLHPTRADRLIIDELTSPVLNGGIADSVWSGIPVTEVSGGKLGVYWEKKYPVWAIDDSFATMRPLSAGLIRLIGRFWRNDTTYRVRLTASYQGRTGSIDIEVRRPDSLGVPSINNRYYMSDVFGSSPFSIDSLICYYAGKEGIPPQVMKGQMLEESSFRNAYRYEPWEDIRFQTNKDSSIRARYFGQGNHFVVTQNNMGTGDPIPTNHTNVVPVRYPTSPMRIGEYVGTNDAQYILTKDTTYLYNPGMTAYWLKWTYYFRDSVEGIGEMAKAAARTRTRDDLINGIIDKDHNLIAQTRIMSSYGMIQMTHYTATDSSLNGFGKTIYCKNPEDLNDHHEVMPAYTQWFMRKLTGILGAPLPQCTWNAGYEETWVRALRKYNRDRKVYTAHVMKYSRYYPPLRRDQ